MKTRSHSRAAFTLLELLVVMAILAIVTALAVRSLDGVQDQRRHEAAQRGLEEIEFAVLGSPDDRAADGSRTISGFVADMGRLPRTNLPSGATFVELRELWENPGFVFDVRAAIAANGLPLADEDTQVLVPGGWRGPYLRLPLGNAGLLDAYGNAVTSPTDSSPANPDATGYARLRDAVDAPITAAAQDVRIVRILGANGRRDTADTGYDRDEAVAFSDDKFRAALVVQVEVLKSDGTAVVEADFPNHDISLRVFGPNPAYDPNLLGSSPILVVRKTVQFSNRTDLPVAFTNPRAVSVDFADGVTIGPRIARAYLHPRGFPGTTATVRRSTVKHVTLRGGANLLDITIDR